MLPTSSAICISALAAVAFALPARAGYEAFSADIEVSPDASFAVTETIVGSFDVERHGIYRAIPVRYDAGYGTRQSIALDVVSVTRDGMPEPYESYREGDYQMIKIGDADVTFDGPFTYAISYRVERALLYGEASDELYWNVTGDAWDDGFTSVGAVVRVPGVAADGFDAACYTGMAGSTASACAISTTDGEVRVTASDFLTVSVSFPKGIVEEPTSWTRASWWMSDNWMVFLLLIPLAVGAWAVRHWYRYGRDPKGRGTIVAEYDPPAGMTPTEMGTLVDAQLHDKDFSAAIVHLAVLGHLQIVEEEGKEFTLKRLKDDASGLKPFEVELLALLFPGTNEAKTKEHRERFVAARKRVAELVYESMAADGYYVQNPDKVRTKYVLAGMAVLFCAFFFPPSMFVLIPTGFILMLLGTWMPRRTEKGQAAFEHARGFQEYLSRAEKYRIQWQEKERIFETFLPFAMAFGVADMWTKALAVQQTAAPGWYVGRSLVFSATDFGTSMDRLGSTLGSVSAPKSSGSSGGSSGGGFGGGGGGSW